MSYALFTQKPSAIAGEAAASAAQDLDALRFEPFPRALPDLALKGTLILIDTLARVSPDSHVYRGGAYSAYDVAFTINRLSNLSTNVLTADDFCNINLQLMQHAVALHLEPLTVVQDGVDAEDAFLKLKKRLAIVHISLLRLAGSHS